ncbi:MAG: hypothetical protein KAS32_21320 [Candidatus Peribacteraceae bacterium]|nr:hypothetical protein [Candidatus Peribacteraceae bacterium]
MEQPQEIRYTKTGRPFIMTPYITSKGNSAMRAKFIPMSDVPGGAGAVESPIFPGSGIGGESGKQPLEAIGSKVVSPTARRIGLALPQEFQKGAPIVLSDAEVGALVDQYSDIHGKMIKTGDLEGSGLFDFLAKIVTFPVSVGRKLVREITKRHPPNPEAGGAVAISNEELQLVLNALPKTSNITKTDVKNIMKFRREIGASPEASGGFLGTLLKLGLPFAVKGLSWLAKKIFGKKKT